MSSTLIRLKDLFSMYRKIHLPNQFNTINLHINSA